jgi:hypothetical protein
MPRESDRSQDGEAFSSSPEDYQNQGLGASALVMDRAYRYRSEYAIM